MRKMIVTLLLTLTILLQMPYTYSAPPTITVMSRNIYLGADVAVAMEAIPNMPKAAQFMWDQVKQNDFSKRVKILANEINESKPDLIGLQEATTWFCKKNAWSKKTEVLNFTKQLISELNGKYQFAAKGEVTAYNPGYSINPIPFLTKVKDPATFKPQFNQDSAACGFETGDAILIKSSLVSAIKNVGNIDYRDKYTIIPILMKVTRGYTYLDLEINGQLIRFITTHLESLWDENKVPNAAKQATQLIEDQKMNSLPTVIVGDFNSDPRDPRLTSDLNPGEQPIASQVCPENSEICNAYKLMVRAGYTNASPDVLNPLNYTWGMNALLTGVDPKRAVSAKQMGNPYGFTDRLDYIFIKNGLTQKSSKIIGIKPPYGTDHAGLVSTLNLRK